MIRRALAHALLLGMLGALLLAVAAFGGGGCPPTDTATSALEDVHPHRGAPD
jgi:hypothetical protein